MTPVTLLPAEMAVCRMIGNLRYHSARIVSNKATPYGGIGRYDLDEDGFIGEYAFCKYWNIFPDITAIPRFGGPDCVLEGRRFDVKTTKWQDGKLMVKEIRNDEIDVYALAIIKDDSVHFPGYCTVNRLKAEGKQFDNNDGTFGYEMTQDQLTRWRPRQQFC